jgi:hypothetical protein
MKSSSRSTVGLPQFTNSLVYWNPRGHGFPQRVSDRSHHLIHGNLQRKSESRLAFVVH